MSNINEDAANKYEDVDLGIMKFIKKGEYFLDLGCATGSLGAAIKARGNKVDGIEYSSQAMKIAKDRLDCVWQGDITEPETILPKNIGKKYDCILFGNVLEHITDPWSTIKKYKKYLKSNGRILVSLPNVCTWTSRLKIMLGLFGYTEVGTFDFTHYRFFNLKTARNLIEEAGFKITRTTVNPNLIRPLTPLIQSAFGRNKKNKLNRVQANQNILNSKPYQMYVKTLYPFETFVANRWKNLLAFQFVFEAKPKKTNR